MTPDTTALRTSAEIGALAEALAKAQGAIRTAEFDRVNPAFKSGYATLASVYHACRAALSTHGLAVVQALHDGPNGRIGLTTRLLHASGQWMEATATVDPGKPGAQALGSAATYLRRYALVSLVGIATGEDDDGEAAEPAPPKRPTKAEREAADKARRETHDASWDADRARFAMACKDAGTSIDDVSAWCEAHGRPRPSQMDAARRTALVGWLRDHGAEVTEWAARAAEQQRAGGEA